jgi:hypothetical protein
MDYFLNSCFSKYQFYATLQSIMIDGIDAKAAVMQKANINLQHGEKPFYSAQINKTSSRV